MNHEISHTTFIEGPSCSGKTCLLKTVDEFKMAVILKNWPTNISNPPTDFFLERDEDKLQRAKESRFPMRLVDRGYLSTLTFYSVLEEQEGVSAAPVYRWFINEMGRNLYRPDSYIFVDVPAEVTLQRAKRSGRIMAENNMWFKHPDRINHWYGRLLCVFEPATRVYKIDGNRNLKLVEEEFKDLLSDLMKGTAK